MTAPKTYVGIDNDINGCMTDTGKIIRNGWVFGLIPESETCEGWVAGQIEELWRKNNVEWEKYGFQVGQLPDEMRETFMRVHQAAMEKARESGWDGEAEIADEE